MSMRSITRNAWTRIFVDTTDDLEAAERRIEQRLRHFDGASPQRLPLKIVAADGDAARVYELSVLVSAEEIMTVEPGTGVPALQDVEARLQWDNGEDEGPYRAWYAIAQNGFHAVAGALALVEADINRVHARMARVEREASATTSLGVSDLSHVSEMLVDIDQVLSHVSYAIGSLSQFARLLRRDAGSTSGVPRTLIDALIQQGEALTRRMEFLVDRHRFHSQGTSQQISTSDLNIVKIFTVLWAILIPGTTLINWYGQNFEFMPELSWEFSSWIQILGVFVLAVLPIYTVKRAGQLR